MSTSPIAALEIGTSRIVVLVGEAEEGRVTVVGTGVAQSFGIRKGQVTDPQNARNRVAAALKLAAERSRTDIGEVFLAASGGHVRSRAKVDCAPVASPDHVVSQDDVADLTERANSFVPEPGREVMHAIVQGFSLDGLGDIRDPVGMHGGQLQLGMLIVDGKKGGIANLRNVAMDARVDVCRVVFGGLCDALAVLTPEQKRNGVAVIDLGGGTTDCLAYADSVIAHAGSVAVGGEHVTNDLSIAFNIGHNQAESLKLQYGNAVVSPDVGLKRIPLPAGLGRDGQTISMRAFRSVINARLDETLRIVRARLHEDRLLHKLNAGVVFTGGGAAMPGLLDLAGSVFPGMPCSVGDPRVNVSGLGDVAEPASFATAAGLLCYGAKGRRRGRGALEAVRACLGRIFG